MSDSQPSPATLPASASEPPQPPAPRRWLPTFGQLAAALSVLGFGVLCFVGGAATIYFRLPIGVPLGQAFAGANQWLTGAGKPEAVPEGQAELAVVKDVAARACDGFTLVTTNEAPDCRLVNMEGRVVHRWALPNDRGWIQGLKGKVPEADAPLHLEQCRLLPNGDLVGLCCSGGDTPYGFALVKLDKSSKLLWAVPGAFHHEVEVDEDGRTYAVEDVEGNTSVLEGLSTAHRGDTLVVVSPQGKAETRLPLVEAFKDTPYLVSFLSGEVIEAVSGPHGPPRPGPTAGPPGLPPMPPGAPAPPAPPQGFPGPGGQPPLPPGGQPQSTASASSNASLVMPGDVLHTNSIHVLGRRAAAKSPLFRAGQVLLSLRSPSLLAVVDVQKRSVVWAARGPWHLQHSAELLDSGRILLFDNMGDPNRSRVLEYDPRTQAVPWSYSGEKEAPFQVPFRGRCQRLPNGNTLVVAPQRWVIEASPKGETLWKLAYPEGSVHPARNITGARRYPIDSLTFLEGANHVRSK